MRILVCGGRDFNNSGLVWEVLNDTIGTETAVIIEGGARGADASARSFARNYRMELITYEADWKTHGKSAGHIRNQKMLDEGKPDLVIAFPGGQGTAHMVKIAKEAKIKVIEIETNRTN